MAPIMCFHTSNRLQPATRLSSQVPSRAGLVARPTIGAITRIPGRFAGGRALVTRASDSKAALNAAAGAIKDLKDPEKIQARVEEASKTLQQAATNLDISQLVRYNFIAQLFLTLSSYAIMFFTTHATIASGAKPGLGTIILIVGTLLTGYSTFLSYGYFSQVKSGGEAVLAGWERLTKFYSHITVNFIGAATGVLALQATVGSQVMGTLANNALTAVHLSKATAEGTNLGLQFLMQAASNILLAHIVSIFFLVLLLKKTTDAYEALISVAEKFKAAMAV